MAKKNVSLIEKGAGYFQGFVTGLMDIAREQKVPLEAIHWLATPEARATLGKIVAIAHEDWWRAEHPVVRAGRSLPPKHYRVYMTYAPMPSFAALKEEFGKDNVSDIFDGQPFYLHSSCIDMDRIPGEKIVYVHDAGDDWESEEVITWGLIQRSVIAPNGYRPMTHEEEYEFQKDHPELVDFVALGSYAVRCGCRFVASAWRRGGRRIFGHDLFGHRWRRRSRVLFVCK